MLGITPRFLVLELKEKTMISSDKSHKPNDLHIQLNGINACTCNIQKFHPYTSSATDQQSQEKTKHFKLLKTPSMKGNGSKLI